MLQWRIQRRGPGGGRPPRPPPGGLGPPLFLDPTEARRAETIFLGDRASPLDDRSPLLRPLSQGLDAALCCFLIKFFLLFLPSALQIRFRYQGYLEGFFTIQQIGMCDVVICLYGQTSGKRPHKLRRVSGRLRQVVAYDSPTAGGFFSKRGPDSPSTPHILKRIKRT